MVGTVPCLDAASVVANVSGLAGGQRSQAKRHQQLAFDDVDDRDRLGRPSTSVSGRPPTAKI